MTFDELLAALEANDEDAHFVRGRIGEVLGVFVDAGTKQPSSLGPGRVFTDFLFEVIEEVGSPGGIAVMEDRVVLRIPGGNVADVTYLWEGAPAIAPGMEVLVRVRDQGRLGGGNTTARIVATVRGWDVFEVRAGMVYSQADAEAVPLRDDY